MRFSEYVSDLEACMGKVYAECLDHPTLPDYVPRQHEPRHRTDYMLDRSLQALGINVKALDDRLADYIAWCQPQIKELKH